MSVIYQYRDLSLSLAAFPANSALRRNYDACTVKFSLYKSLSLPHCSRFSRYFFKKVSPANMVAATIANFIPRLLSAQLVHTKYLYTQECLSSTFHEHLPCQKAGAFVDSLPHPAPFCHSILDKQNFICITD